MATFPFFSNRKKDFSRLIEQSRLLVDAQSKQNFAEQVDQVFDPLIDPRLSRAERADGTLQRIILFELCGLIGTLPRTDTYFADKYKTVLDELIGACRWKQRLPDCRFDELAHSSTSHQLDIQHWITHIRQRQTASHVQRLARLLSPTDQQAVAYRTLRAFLAYEKKQDRSVVYSTGLFWLRDDRVQLRISLLRDYLFEQIALRVYLVYTTAEADFIEESLSQVYHWVIAQVTFLADSMGPELIEGVEDMVSTVKLECIDKLNRYRAADPEAFFLDARLTTYLIGFVKKSAAISKLLAAQKPNRASDEQSNDSGGDAYTDYTDERPDAGDWPDDIFAFGTDDQWEEERSILQTCLTLVGKACHELIIRHYNDGFSQPVPFSTLAIEFGESAKTLESRFYSCLGTLKKMAIDAYTRQHTKPYSR